MWEAMSDASIHDARVAASKRSAKKRRTQAASQRKDDAVNAGATITAGDSS
jgi:hypothetical protein